MPGKVEQRQEVAAKQTWFYHTFENERIVTLKLKPKHGWYTPEEEQINTYLGDLNASVSCLPIDYLQVNIMKHTEHKWATLIRVYFQNKFKITNIFFKKNWIHKNGWCERDKEHSFVIKRPQKVNENLPAI